MSHRNEGSGSRGNGVNYHKLGIRAGYGRHAEAALGTSGGQQRTAQSPPLQLGLVLLVAALQPRVVRSAAAGGPRRRSLRGHTGQTGGAERPR